MFTVQKRSMTPAKTLGVVVVLAVMVVAGLGSNQKVSANNFPVNDPNGCVHHLYAKGNASTCVKYIQYLANHKLPHYGYAPLTADGIFGTKTKAGIVRIQKAYRLTQDGIVGENTWAALCDFYTSYSGGYYPPTKYELSIWDKADCIDADGWN